MDEGTAAQTAGAHPDGTGQSPVTKVRVTDGLGTQKLARDEFHAKVFKMPQVSSNSFVKTQFLHHVIHSLHFSSVQ